MATYSSILAWKIPWTEELDGLQPMQRAGHDRTSMHTCMLSLKIIQFNRFPLSWNKAD